MFNNYWASQDSQCKHENYPSITKRDHGGDDLMSQNKNYFEREIW